MGTGTPRGVGGLAAWRSQGAAPSRRPSKHEGARPDARRRDATGTVARFEVRCWVGGAPIFLGALGCRSGERVGDVLVQEGGVAGGVAFLFFQDAAVAADENAVGSARFRIVERDDAGLLIEQDGERDA